MITYKKHVGETSLETLERARVEFSIKRSVPMTYAGTLDPMADGLLLLLVGEECKNKKLHTQLPKEYEVEILFGVSTDTDDILGLIQNTAMQSPSRGELEEVLQTLIGKRTEKYHPFSHKKIGGTPLFEHAKIGTISEIEIPEREIEIYSTKLLKEKTYHKDELEARVFENLSKVQGDFRQKEIIKLWQEFFARTEQPVFQSFTIQVSCSSGTYMRTLVRNISNTLDIPAVALQITRTKIGNSICAQGERVGHE